MAKEKNKQGAPVIAVWRRLSRTVVPSFSKMEFPADLNNEKILKLRSDTAKGKHFWNEADNFVGAGSCNFSQLIDNY